MKLILFTILSAAMAAAAEEKSVADLLQRGNEQFTAKMFSEVVKANPGKSVVLSAFSVMTPLAQLSFATEGVSHDELLRAIGLPNDNATKDVFELINKSLRSVKGVELKMASRIYVRNTGEVNEDFQSNSRQYFGSDVKSVDFIKKVETAADMNAWVEDQTNHRIKNLVEPDSLDASTQAVLVNAIYFKGKWQNPFDSKLTKDLDFHVTKDKVIKVPTMTKKGDYDYTESTELKAKILRLPYDGDQASMLIVLPDEIEGLSELQEKLKDPEALSKATKSMYKHEVDVALPKFKIESTIDLKEVLENMDVTRIFSPNEAQLNNLLKGESDLFISQAKQKAFIEVNEEGAEAAAANAFTGLGAVFDPNPPMEFHANRPFYLDIRVQKNAYAIFNGVYTHVGSEI